MALRTIVKEGASVLRKKARPIEKFDQRLKDLAGDMIETMEANNGLGLAANQVGILRRLFVMKIEEEGDPLVICNPEILQAEGENIDTEGCLSIPGVYGTVKRPAKLLLSYQDLSGKQLEMEAEALTAACICHELDHLNGILFRDHVIEYIKPQEEESDA